MKIKKIKEWIKERSNLRHSEFLNVTPLGFPSGKLFYFDFIYKDSKDQKKPQ